MEPTDPRPDNKKYWKRNLPQIVESWLHKIRVDTDRIALIDSLFGKGAYEKLPSVRLGPLALINNIAFEEDLLGNNDRYWYPIRYNYRYDVGGNTHSYLDKLLVRHMFTNPEGQGLVPIKYAWEYKQHPVVITPIPVPVAAVLKYPVGKILAREKSILMDDEEIASMMEVGLGNGSKYYLAGVVMKDTKQPVGTLFITKLNPPANGGDRKKAAMEFQMQPAVW